MLIFLARIVRDERKNAKFRIFPGKITIRSLFSCFPLAPLKCEITIWLSLRSLQTLQKKYFWFSNGCLPTQLLTVLSPWWTIPVNNVVYITILCPMNPGTFQEVTYNHVDHAPFCPSESTLIHKHHDNMFHEHILKMEVSWNGGTRSSIE